MSTAYNEDTYCTNSYELLKTICIKKVKKKTIFYNK
jgi:hypothetical protein